MEVQIIEAFDDGLTIYNTAMTTIGKAPKPSVPNGWLKKMFRSEHSPIRMFKIHWKWIGIPYWVSVHFVRHKFGIEHYVSTQRTDRTGKLRDELPQGALVNHECEANAQAMINISRKRLCMKASYETRAAWGSLLDALPTIVAMSELKRVCVRECIYRGFCPEFKSCGYDKTLAYVAERADYIDKE